MTVLVTTHYLAEAAYCDRIGMMHRGQLIAHGTLAALRTSTHSAPDASVETVFVRALGEARAEEANS
jgi:ABC-2 type transport system ATP-binding protein